MTEGEVDIVELFRSIVSDYHAVKSFNRRIKGMMDEIKKDYEPIFGDDWLQKAADKDDEKLNMAKRYSEYRDNIRDGIGMKVCRMIDTIKGVKGE